jgi:hypothetical protein
MAVDIGLNCLVNLEYSKMDFIAISFDSESLFHRLELFYERAIFFGVREAWSQIIQLLYLNSC